MIIIWVIGGLFFLILLIIIAKGSSTSDVQKHRRSFEIGLMKRCDQCASYVELQAKMCSSCASTAFTAIDRSALERKRQIIVAVGIVLCVAFYYAVKYNQ